MALKEKYVSPYITIRNWCTYSRRRYDFEARRCTAITKLFLITALVLQRISLKLFSGLKKVQLHFQQEEKVQDFLSTLLLAI